MKIVLSLALVLSGLTAQATIMAPSNQMCLMVVSKMRHTVTKNFAMAMNSCEAAELKKQGYIEVDMDMNPTEDVVDQEQEQEQETQPKLSLITEGKFKTADKDPAKCREGRVCVPNSLVAIKNSQLVLALTLKGCLDSAYVSYKTSYNHTTRVTTVLVNAVNVGNKKSETVRCFAAPVVTKTIDLGFSVTKETPIKVEFVQNEAI